MLECGFAEVRDWEEEIVHDILNMTLVYTVVHEASWSFSSIQIDLLATFKSSRAKVVDEVITTGVVAMRLLELSEELGGGALGRAVGKVED